MNQNILEPLNQEREKIELTCISEFKRVSFTFYFVLRLFLKLERT